MPPLAQGVGILALPGLVDITALLLKRIPGLEGSAARMADLSRELAVVAQSLADPDRRGRPVGRIPAAAELATRRGTPPRRDAGGARCRAPGRLIADPSPVRGRARARPMGRWFAARRPARRGQPGPALLFTPWTDGRTIAPGMLVLADGPGDARLQAAALACCLIAANLAALCAATVASGPPPEWDPEPS